MTRLERALLFASQVSAVATILVVCALATLVILP
jgi:hypothetical protein